METNSKILAPLVLSACLLPVVSLAGCLREESITLQHAQHQPAVVARAQDVRVEVQVHDRRDHLAPGISRTWGRAVVGFARNPLGEPIAPDIVVIEPIEMSFRRVVEGELGARGFRVGGGAARFQLVIDIETFFNDF